jgi:hypothetical protein
MVHMQSLTFQDTDLTYIFERANKKNGWISLAMLSHPKKIPW